jgi:polysaccharide deacetylase family protein (PEP-CTERM system associated)
MLNALVIDVEDWFHICNIKSGYTIKDWHNLESRVEKNTKKILEILKKKEVKASFFILGWIAERYPHIVNTIAEEGHEIGSHGYAHNLVYETSPEEFRKDLRKSLHIINKINEDKIYGYRAPGFSITQKTSWAFDILASEGIKYDASVFPAVRGHGGIRGAPIYAYLINTSGGSIIEFPASVFSFMGINIAFCGGGYLRFFPYWFIKYRIKRMNKKGHPVVVSLHPREIDPHQPRMKLSLKRRFKYYVKLSSMENKLTKILKDFNFGPMREVLHIK